MRCAQWRGGRDTLLREMRRLVFALLIAPSFAGAGDRPPHRMIEEAYFVCEPSRSLQGGIFGKGPLRAFGPLPGGCSATEWRRLTRDEFKSRATEWYAKDWGTEIPFFSEVRKPK
jgi:hypothetical protein